MSVGPWQPLWIGSAPHRLYGALHGASGASTAVLMAPPLLHEQPRSRRVLVEVASRIAEGGLPCLRFDYLGTGDSDGAGNQHDFAQVAHDLDAACSALAEATSAKRIVVLAWRAAALPACAWARDGGRVAAVAAWEPIVDGNAWLAALESTDRAERRQRYGDSALVDDGYLVGFEVSPRWRIDVAGARLERQPAVPLWSFERNGAMTGTRSDQRFTLPADAPRFDDGVGIENAMFLSRSLFAVVDDFVQHARVA